MVEELVSKVNSKYRHRALTEIFSSNNVKHSIFVYITVQRGEIFMRWWSSSYRLIPFIKFIKYIALKNLLKIEISSQKFVLTS